MNKVLEYFVLFPIQVWKVNWTQNYLYSISKGIASCRLTLKIYIFLNIFHHTLDMNFFEYSRFCLHNKKSQKLKNTTRIITLIKMCEKWFRCTHHTGYKLVDIIHKQLKFSTIPFCTQYYKSWPMNYSIHKSYGWKKGERLPFCKAEQYKSTLLYCKSNQK